MISVETAARKGIAQSLSDAILPSVMTLVKGRVNDYFADIGYRKVAKLSTPVLVSSLFDVNPLQGICKRIGAVLELAWIAEQQDEPGEWMRNFRRLEIAQGWSRAVATKCKDEPRWEQSDRNRAGLVIMNFILRHTDFIELRRPPDSKTKYVYPSGSAHELMELARAAEREQAKDRRPSADPHNENTAQSIMLRGRGPTEGCTAPRVIETVNAVQRIPWRVNARVAEVYKECLIKGHEIAGLPGRNRPKWDDEVSSAEWAHRRNRETAWIVGKAEQIRTAAAIAEIPNPTYFRWGIDFRGRMYPRGTIVSPQGGDAVRGALEFAEGKPIGLDGGRFLARHGANMFGVKGSEAARVGWVSTHEEMILRTARDPFGEIEWAQASDPWRFLAFCFEWEGYQRDGERFVTHLPCQADATANGLQILALLTRDRDLAAKVNLLPSVEPQDIYTAVGRRVLDHVYREAASAGLKSLWAGWLRFLGGEIPRDVVKRACMPLIFGGTTHAAAKGLRSYIWSRPDFCGFHRVRSATLSLAAVFRTALTAEVGPLRGELVAWLRDVMGQNGEVAWDAPTGMQILVNPKQARMITTSHPNMPQLNVYSETDQPDVKKARASILAHMSHSLDGACMALALEEMPFPAVPIHDCILTRAPDLGAAVGALKRSYAQVFAVNPLHNFAAQQCWEGVDPPESGTLDPGEILQAQYMFS